MKKIIILIIAVIIVGGVVYWWQTSISNTNDFTTESDTNYEISDWQTYQNEKIGFEIKYPTDWITVVTNANSWDVIGFREVNLKPGDPSFSRIYIQLKDNPNNYSLKEYYKNLSDTSDMYIPYYFDIGTTKNLTIDGIEAVQFPIIPGPISNTKTSIPLDQVILEIDKHNDYEPADRIYDLMIQSLKFKD